jgi:hypothetical protein
MQPENADFREPPGHGPVELLNSGIAEQSRFLPLVPAPGVQFKKMVHQHIAIRGTGGFKTH